MARDLDLDLGSGHTAYRYASLVDLYVHNKYVIEIEETFCGRTGGKSRKETNSDQCRHVKITHITHYFITDLMYIYISHTPMLT